MLVPSRTQQHNSYISIESAKTIIFEGIFFMEECNWCTCAFLWELWNVIKKLARKLLLIL